LDDPLRTITTENRFAIVQPFLVPHYGEREGQEPRTHAIDEPCPTIPASGGGKFGVVEPLILSAGGPECAALPASRPMGTVLTRDHRALVRPFLIPYNGPSGPASLDVPLHTVTTKDRFALIDGHPVRLDITFRMLQPHELAAAQGFAGGYQFAGNKGDQVKQIGNAVPVGTAKALALEALGA
jgi:DNA (cytosine-5)-methyltransferase 1